MRMIERIRVKLMLRDAGHKVSINKIEKLAWRLYLRWITAKYKYAI